ncbi:hypothetical protein FA15DRAFT_758867 [Coprinopsis marcescibilis]|uniref:BTB domain-containing protein n=1 Tax=Coprinopsis marcescibilis TaxID=230819 RepID=A0A5C3KM08_COPMA|nr:hypothetical protein FA15DRAFT_758867 [Coprinopsis marcescibilis]
MSKRNGSSNSAGKTDDSKMKFIKHHSEYYLQGGDLYIMIDTTMFKIHSHFFSREARNFDANVADANSSHATKQGTTENTAIIVENATIREFEKFLWVFYNPIYDSYQTDLADWFSILRLAHEWEFPSVKKFALRQLKERESDIPLVKRIVLYRDYNAPLECLVPLYAELCARPEAPDDDEVGCLGLAESLKIFKAREQVRATGHKTVGSPLPKGIHETDTYATISSILDLPHYNPDPADARPTSATIKVGMPQPKKSKTSASEGTSTSARGSGSSSSGA